MVEREWGGGRRRTAVAGDVVGVVLCCAAEGAVIADAAGFVDDVAVAVLEAKTDVGGAEIGGASAVVAVLVVGGVVVEGGRGVFRNRTSVAVNVVLAVLHRAADDAVAAIASVVDVVSSSELSCSALRYLRCRRRRCRHLSRMRSCGD